MGLPLIALGVGVVMVCPIRPCAVLQVDHALLQLFQTWQQPWLTFFFAAITWLGSMFVLLPASLLFAWHFKARGQTRSALLLPLSVAGAWLLAHAGKLMVQRPRPDLFPPLIAMPQDLSFPSAHAMQVAAFALALVLALNGARQRVVITVALCAVVAVALSRLYLQVHFPSDVFFGLIAGAGWALGLWLLMRTRP